MVLINMRHAGAGTVHRLDVPEQLQAEGLHSQAAAQLQLAPERFKLVLGGRTLAAGSTVKLREGDTLVVVPQRRPPSERIQRAAQSAQDLDPDDEPLQFSLPDTAPAWERLLASFLQRTCRAPDLLLVWLWTLQPRRVLLLLLVAAGARVAHHFELGPVYILVCLLVTMFVNLGRRTEGEASAYSVFNAGVARLPGQLDADQLDQQIRRGQM